MKMKKNRKFGKKGHQVGTPNFGKKGHCSVYPKTLNTRAQAEMVGFALIIIVVSVVLLIMLGLALTNSTDREELESYEIDSFIQSFLYYKTDCEDNFGKISIQELILDCDRDESCLDGRNSCQVLENKLEEIVAKSWNYGENRPEKGYALNITKGPEKILGISDGIKTENYKGSVQYLGTGDDQSIAVKFKIYSGFGESSN